MKRRCVMPTCRFCEEKLSLMVSLGKTPLANSYLKDIKTKEAKYALDLYLCDKCFLVQLLEYEKSENIFSEDYAYYSSYSVSWLEHCKKYAEMIIDKLQLNDDSLVVEIGSNDGYLLQYFVQKHISVLGVEPSGGVAKEAIRKGIPTDIIFFNESYGKKLSQSRQADLIIGNNVFAHTPFLNDFVKGLKLGLKENGVITLEFPHLLQLILQNQFDTIYHEHFSYFSFYTVQKIFQKYGLDIFDVEELSTHGGSLRIYGKHFGNDKFPISKSVNTLLEKEKNNGLLDVKTYYNFGKKVTKVKENLLSLLQELKRNGKRIACYGAPAKGNTLLNYCGIGQDLFNYTVDISPYKQDKYLPGSHLPILHPKTIEKDKPDYILILPWNLKEEIIKQLSCVKTWGGHFIVAIPEPEIIA